MKTLPAIALPFMGALLAWGATDAFAQQHNHARQRGPSYHIDHHDHVIRDSHGHVIGRYHHDVVHQDSTFIVPHTDVHHHGTYYIQNGRSFYSPQTASSVRLVQPEQIVFGGFSHVDDLASRLETMSNEFCLDLHYNYSHNPGYQETYREAYELLQTAKFIHAAEHHNDRLTIQQKLGGLDQLFHHLEDDVQHWTRHQHRQIGHLGIASKMDLMESTLHHLMNDVVVTPTPINGNEQAPPPGGGPEQAPPPSGLFAPPLEIPARSIESASLDV